MENLNRTTYDTSTGSFIRIEVFKFRQKAIKIIKSDFNPVHVFLNFGTFSLVVLQLILASKLSKLEQFENWEANFQ